MIKLKFIAVVGIHRKVKPIALKSNTFVLLKIEEKITLQVFYVYFRGWQMESADRHEKCSPDAAFPSLPEMRQRVWGSVISVLQPSRDN